MKNQFKAFSPQKRRKFYPSDLVLNFDFHLLPKSIRDGFKKNHSCVPWKKGGKYWSSLPIQNRLNVRHRYFMHICRSYVICISGVVYYYYLILHTLQMFYP